MMSKIQFELCCLLVTFMVLIHFVTFRMVTTKKANSNEACKTVARAGRQTTDFYDLTTAAYTFLVILNLLHYLTVNEFTTDLL